MTRFYVPLLLIAALCVMRRVSLAADTASSPTPAQRDRDRAARLTAYLAKPFADEITSISIDDQQIRIEGRLT